MEFPSEDISSSDVDSPRVDLGQVERQAYIGRLCPLVPNYENFSGLDRVHQDES